jgi:hypothetical protein
MPDPHRDRPSFAGRLRGLRGGRRRALLGAGGVLGAGVLVAVLLAGRAGDSQSLDRSPPLPSTYRPGSANGPVSLGDSRSAVLASLSRARRRSVRGTLVFDRPGGQLAVSFLGDRVVRLLATGATNPFGQRLVAEERTLSSWTIELCRKPPHLLLVAPGGHTYFVFQSAVAGLGAVGVSAARVTPCGPLG